MVEHMPIPNLPEKSGFSAQEKRCLGEKLMRLVKKQTERYNGVDSTSISEEKLRELAESMLYTLSAAAGENEKGIKSLLNADLEVMLNQGQNILNKKRVILKSKWNTLKVCMPKIENAYYIGTLENISVFFENYDIYYGAHLIPCSIDYPLMRPVLEQLLGISYIEEYIRALCIESAFVNRFEKNRAIGLYNRLFADYTETPANLCEPLFTNALALAVLQKSKTETETLAITESDIKSLYGIFENKTEKEIAAVLEKSAAALCAVFGAENEKENYFIESARSLSVRIYTAVKYNNLNNIFV